MVGIVPTGAEPEEEEVVEVVGEQSKHHSETEGSSSSESDELDEEVSLKRGARSGGVVGVDEDTWRRRRWRRRAATKLKETTRMLSKHGCKNNCKLLSDVVY